MTTIPLATSDWRRSSPNEPVIKVQNRFFEVDPANAIEGSTMVCRPGFKKFTTLSGVSAINSVYAAEGLFQGSFFALTDIGDIKVAPTGTSAATSVTTPSTIPHNNQGTFTGALGDIPGYFFSINGGDIYVTAETSFSSVTLTASGNPENNAVVRLGDMYYKFTTGSVDTGTPAGTVASPWLVTRAATTAASLVNLFDAVNTLTATTAGTFSAVTERNPSVNPVTITSTTIVFQAEEAGFGGDGIISTVSATSNLSFSGGVTSGGGNSAGSSAVMSQKVFSPETAISFKAIDTVSSYVIAVAYAEDTQYSGRFYWIRPGETQIDPLSFATTEMAPDTLLSVRVVGQFIWLFGSTTTEIWFQQPDPDIPFKRLKGQSMNTGIVLGSDQVVDNGVYFISKDYKVRTAKGTELTPISTPSEEEQIRIFLETDTATTVNTVRTWPTNADGHLFYIINLGTTGTLSYDITSQKWTHWKTDGISYLKPCGGISALIPYSGHTSGVTKYLPMAIDNISNQIWWVDPDYNYDDAPGGTNIAGIECVVTSGLPARMRENTKCNELYLTGSVGSPGIPSGSPTLSPSVTNPRDVLLEYSDDNGETWVSAGGITIVANDFTQEIVWRSLGIIQAPGRLFRITDYNAMKRIDGLDLR